MTGDQFLLLSKADKQNFVAGTLTYKKDTPEGKLYYIPATACCGHKVEWGWGKAPKVCPYCGSVHWQKPALEYFLFVEQDKLVEELPCLDRLGEKMFPLIYDYAKNLIQKIIKNSATLESEDLDEKAHDAATMLVEVILKDPDHTMKWSFGGYLKRLCKSVVYSNKKYEQVYSLNAITGESDRELEETIIIHDPKADPGESAILNLDPDDLSSQVVNLIKESSDAIWFNTQRQEECLLFLLGMLLRFKHKDDKSLIDFYSLVGNQTKRFVEKGELVVYAYLKNLT